MSEFKEPSPNHVDVAIQRLHDQLPELARIAAEQAQDIVQATTWLVGIATTLLAVLASKSDAFGAGVIGRRVLAVALFAAILAGVIQRITQLQTNAKERAFLIKFRSQVAYLLRWTGEDPVAPFDAMGVELAEANLERYFPQTHSLLKKLGLGGHFLRETYDAEYARWSTSDKDRARQFSRLLAAMNGKELLPGEELKPVDGIADLRKDMLSIRRWSLTTRLALLTMGGSFVVALGVIAYGALT